MFNWLTSSWNRVPAWVKNRYFVVLALFSLLLLFVDNHNLFQLVKRKQSLHELRSREKQLQEELVELKQQKEAFQNNKEALEKFAREEYRMKAEDEDIFVIVAPTPLEQ